MILRLFLVALVALAFTSCHSLEQKKKTKKTAETDLPNVNGDVSFQAFLGQLRQAVAAHDAATIASMMTPNFGYRLDPPGEGEGVFQFWEEKGIWPELQLVLREKFLPNGSYMVAPAQFATRSDYHGYRAGITMISGSWKFAYFVND